MGRVRSGRRHVTHRMLLGGCVAIGFAGLAVMGVGLLGTEAHTVDDAIRTAQPGFDAEPSAGVSATVEAPRFQLPSVPTIRPVADAIDSGIAAAVGIALLTFFGLVARNPAAFLACRARRISPRGPPMPAVARP